MMSYVNLKDLAEFNKYTTGLGAGALVYIDKVDSGNEWIRTLGIVLAAVVVILGIIVMSIKGRIKGDDIDYATEPDSDRKAPTNICASATRPASRISRKGWIDWRSL